MSGISFIPLVTTTYTVTGTDTNLCSNTETITINVNDVTTILDGITISSNQAGATYQWLDCQNGYSPTPGATDKVIQLR